MRLWDFYPVIQEEFDALESEKIYQKKCVFFQEMLEQAKSCFGNGAKMQWLNLSRLSFSGKLLRKEGGAKVRVN